MAKLGALASTRKMVLTLNAGLPSFCLPSVSPLCRPSLRSRVELYEMDWVHRDNGQGIGLERYIVATGPLGGMIGEMRLLLSFLPSSNCAVPHKLSARPPPNPSRCAVAYHMY